MHSQLNLILNQNPENVDVIDAIRNQAKVTISFFYKLDFPIHVQFIPRL